MRIDINNWKEFNLTELFDIEGSKTTPKKDIQFESEGQYPYVTTASSNNGISGYSNTYTEDGNVITIDSATDGIALYQKENFTASDHVEKLIPKFKINKYIALFLCSILNKNIQIYSYGYNQKRSQTSLKKEKIILPVIENKIDLEYMENYMKEIENKAKNKIENLELIKCSYNNYIDHKNWTKYKIKDLFDIKLATGDLKEKKCSEGDIPLISSGKYNNGICKLIEEQNTSDLFQKNTLTVDMFGKVFYQPNDYYSVSHGRVNMLIPKDNIKNNFNNITGLYIASVIEKTIEHDFQFNEMCCSTKLKKIDILLPSLNNKPNWQYMENYINSIENIANNKINILKNIIE